MSLTYALTPTELLARATAEAFDRPAHHLFAGAALMRLVSRGVVLTGSGAQFIHTGIARPAPIEAAAELGLSDRRRLAEAGLTGDGPRYAFIRGAFRLDIVLRPPEADLLKPPLQLFVAGVGVNVLSATDLMLDRIERAAGGTPESLDDAADLAGTMHPFIDWFRLRERAVAMAGAGPAWATLPHLVDEYSAIAA